MRSLRRAIAVLFLLTGLFTGCKEKPPTPLRVGTTVFPSYDLLLLARQRAYFDETLIQIIDYPGTPEIHRSFQNHAIEAATVTLDEALFLAQTDPGLRIVMVMDFSNGADVLLCKPEIASLPVLKGKRVGTELNTVGSYMLARALERADLTVPDIIIVPLSATEALKAFAQDEVDAVITYEPTKSKLRALGAHQLFDSSEIPGEIADVLIVREEVLRRREKELTELLRGWFRAVRFFKSNPAEAVQPIAAREGLAPQACLEAFATLEIPDHQKNLDLLKADGGLSDTIRRVCAEMVKYRLLEKMLEPKLLLDNSIIKRAAP